MSIPKLVGKTIYLDELVIDDLTDMHEYSRIADFYSYLEFSPHKTVDETRQYLYKLIDRKKTRNSIYWAIHLKENDKMVGTFGILDVDKERKRAQIGYGVSPIYWNRGIFKEALSLVLEFCFYRLGLERISALTAIDNVASNKGLECVGFQRDGYLRKYYKNNDGTRSTAVSLSILKDEFLNPNGKYIGNEIKYVKEVLDSENPKNKKEPWVGRLESYFSQLFNTRYSIVHNSGTSTLHSCLFAAGVNVGSEVIMPAQTVSMLAFVTLALGATPVFVDIDECTFNIDTAKIERAITERTKAIIAVHMHGLPADMDEIVSIGKKYNIPIIEDSAQCMFGWYKGRLAGTIGDMASFSFETKKHLSVGEGGIVTTNNSEFATRIRRFGGLGYKTLSSKAGLTQLLPSDFQDPDYKRHSSVGLNYRMPEICAAVLLAQLERADEIVERRKEIAKYFLNAVKECDWIIPQYVPDDYVNSYWTFTVRYIGDLSWREFYNIYKKNGGDGFYGGLSVVYQELFMKDFDYINTGCPIAEKVQPQMMQFKTNYRKLDIAKYKADILSKTIREINGT